MALCIMSKCWGGVRAGWEAGEIMALCIMSKWGGVRAGWEAMGV